MVVHPGRARLDLPTPLPLMYVSVDVPDGRTVHADVHPLILGPPHPFDASPSGAEPAGYQCVRDDGTPRHPVSAAFLPSQIAHILPPPIAWLHHTLARPTAAEPRAQSHHWHWQSPGTQAMRTHTRGGVGPVGGWQLHHTTESIVGSSFRRCQRSGLKWYVRAVDVW